MTLYIRHIVSGQYILNMQKNQEGNSLSRTSGLGQ